MDGEMATAKQSWLSTELQEDPSLRKVADIPTSPNELVKDFFDWQFKTSAFDFIVASAADKHPVSKIIQRHRLNGSQLIFNQESAKLNQTSLVWLAQKGFMVLVATNSDTNELICFFYKRGYRNIGSSLLSSGKKHDPLRVSWNRENLAMLIAIAIRMGAKLICCFAHDADPIYLLYSSKNSPNGW